MSNIEIEKLRNIIDDISDQILRLIEKRVATAREIGEIKSKNGIPIEDKQREKQILRQITEKYSGSVGKFYVRRIFKEIIRACREVQYLKLGYLGPLGSFSYEAALEFASEQKCQFKLIPHKDISSIVKNVVLEKIDYGVIPIENSLEGFVNQNLKILHCKTQNIFVVGEIIKEVKLCLLSTNKELEKINVIYSHEFGIREAYDWISKNLPNVRLVPMESTSKAAKVASETPEAAAIASESCSGLYNLNILEKGLNQGSNYTKFFLITKRSRYKSDFLDLSSDGKFKLILLCNLEGNISQRINGLIEIISSYGLSIEKINVIPSGRSVWGYDLYLEINSPDKEGPTSLIKEKLKERNDIIVMGAFSTGVKINLSLDN